jgi:hypothetical protein
MEAQPSGDVAATSFSMAFRFGRAPPVDGRRLNHQVEPFRMSTDETSAAPVSAHTDPAPSDHPALTALREFWDAMHAWEAGMIRESANLERMFEGQTSEQIVTGMRALNDDARERLAAIFERYCEAGRDAKRLGHALHFGGTEPTYNSAKESVLVVTSRGQRSVIVETQMSHQLRNRLRYELIQMGGQWKVKDNRKFWAESAGKWQPMNL